MNSNSIPTEKYLKKNILNGGKELGFRNFQPFDN